MKNQRNIIRCIIFIFSSILLLGCNRKSLSPSEFRLSDISGERPLRQMYARDYKIDETTITSKFFLFKTETIIHEEELSKSSLTFAGGVIMHLLSNRYEKKITEKIEPKATNFFERHKAVTIILVLVVLIIIASAASTKEKTETVQTSTNQTNTEITPSESVQLVKSVTPSPVVAEKISVTRDSIGTPEANVTYKNISTKEIDGIKARFKVFNNFDEPVNGFLSDNNNFDALSQDKIPAGASSEGTWAMYNFDGASKIKVEIFHVHFTDGTTWEE